MLTPVTRDERQWDAFVQAHGGGFLQSWGWSQFQEAVGRRTFRFRVGSAGAKEEEGDTLSQFVLVELPLAFGFRYAYVPRGPVVRRTGDKEADTANIVSCVEALRQKISRDRLAFARVEWPWPLSENVVTKEGAAKWGFRPADHVQPQHTVIADLTGTEERLLAAMHQKTRYNIRVAEKHGVTVREALRDDAHLLEHDVDVFWGMLHETASRDKFSTHERKYYGTMLDVLSPKKSEGLRARLFFAEYEGRAVAAAMTGEFGDTVTYLHGASLAGDRKVMGPYLLHWHIMKDAKSRGFAKYDFWGVAPSDDPDHAWAGITRFKTGFGGERVEYLGTWELPGNGLWYTLYRYAKRLRRS